MQVWLPFQQLTQAFLQCDPGEITTTAWERGPRKLCVFSLSFLWENRDKRHLYLHLRSISVTELPLGLQSEVTLVVAQREKAGSWQGGLEPSDMDGLVFQALGAVLFCQQITGH